MSMKLLGGNRLQILNLQKSGPQLLAEGPYVYSTWMGTGNQTETISGLASWTLFVRKLSSDAKATLTDTRSGQEYLLKEGDAVQVENGEATLHTNGGRVDVLIGGVRNSVKPGTLFERKTLAQIKRVQKPWGHELWINGEHPGYALKEIFIKTGTKTSLQYHRLKQETNVLFEGTAKLHYKQNAACDNDRVTPADIATETLNPACSVDVPPTMMHRLEAVTDVLLYEISTPHLDDVVRVSDDAGRPDGRIKTEHGA